MSAFAIRPAAPSDARSIAEIHYAGWQIAYAQIITAEEMASRLPERRVTFWQDRIADPADLVLIAEDTRGAPQGFMHGGRALEHDIRAGSLANHDCEIYSLHCRQAVHGRGLGRLLMAETARIFRDQGALGPRAVGLSRQPIIARSTKGTAARLWRKASTAKFPMWPMDGRSRD